VVRAVAAFADAWRGEGGGYGEGGEEGRDGTHGLCLQGSYRLERRLFFLVVGWNDMAAGLTYTRAHSTAVRQHHHQISKCRRSIEGLKQKLRIISSKSSIGRTKQTTGIVRPILRPCRASSRIPVNGNNKASVIHTSNSMRSEVEQVNIPRKRYHVDHRSLACTLVSKVGFIQEAGRSRT
jgi:hypothetical protein